MIVREIEPDDYDDVLRLTKEFYKSAAEPFGYKFEIDCFDSMFKLACNRDILKCFIAKDGDEAVGLSCVGVAKALFSNQILAQEMIWYVVPHKRGNMRIGLKLYQALERVAKNCDIFDMICTQTSDSRADRFYERQGFKLAEKHYIRS